MKTTKLTIEILLLSALTLSSCHNIKIKKKKTEQSTSTNLNTQTNSLDANSQIDSQNELTVKDSNKLLTKPEDLEKYIDIQIREDLTPYKYNIQISWPQFSDKNKIVRVSINSMTNEIDSNFNYFNLIAHHNQTLTAYFDVLNENKNKEFSFSKEITIPKDFVVEENHFVLDNPITKEGQVFYEFNRIYLNPKYPLLIPNAVANIKINSLFGDPNKESIIANYLYSNHLNAVKSSDNGRDGGKLIFEIKNLYGYAHFKMAGEDGAFGVNGLPWIQRANDGANGTNGFCQSRDFLLPRDGGPISRPCICVDKGIPAIPGKNGEPGRNGTHGKNGGASGDLQINIENFASQDSIQKQNATQFFDYVKMTLIPGQKGLKGIGSDGQDGGFGGTNASGKCASKGPEKVNGTKGQKGADGENGLDGVRGYQCITVKSIGINICE